MAQKIIADASVIAKWFINEENSKESRALLKRFISMQIELLEPSLLKYEVLNALRFTRNIELSIKELEDVSEAIDSYGFEIKELDKDLSTKAIEISKTKDISIYDAVYVALAESTGSFLYTADKKLMSDCKMDMIRHIKDL